ncbi:MAG: WxcM-like domain-containing protein [Bacteroidetes bacterium]|nr:WxcM-like domain-containing protein [Bacteroidota bacterium]
MNKRSTIYDCSVVHLPKVNNRAGNITFVENNIHVSFSISRIYYLYDIPAGAERGGHAHKELHHFMVAASGSFNVILDDGINKKVVELNRPDYGLYIPPGIWAELFNFSSGAISLNLVSEKYDENDYLRKYDEFLLFKGKKLKKRLS